MIGAITAELLVIRKRSSTWVLVGLFVTLAVLFGYLFPYFIEADSGAPRAGQPLDDLLPGRLVGTTLGGFPFFGGAIVLILGVLTLGSDYGWGTLKTLFTQRPSRLQILGAKLAAVGVVLWAFVLADFAAAFVCSGLIAMRENAPADWPSVWLLVRALAAAWFILAVWATLGVLLGVLMRGTALGIGIGILYGLAIEGLFSAFFNRSDLLRPLIEAFLRANAYSLVAPLGVSAEATRDNGPGSFSGPYVGGEQAALVLGVYLVAFVGLSAWILRRRDVT
jgi:ABC-type transport system involved in multi-copper enzyme maturation permease subunit